MHETGKHNTAGCDTVDFGKWPTTTDNAVRARQAFAGIHHENIEVRQLCSNEDPLCEIQGTALLPG